jgi:RHS repeat-associated protein
MTFLDSTSNSPRTTIVRRVLRSRVLILLSATITALALASVAWGRVGARRAAAMPLFFAGDTTIVFGPDTNRTNNGNRNVHVEVLGVSAQAGKQYTIRATRIGSGNLAEGTLTLNHHEIATKSNFPTTGTTLNLPVKILGADTLVVEVNGGVTDGLVVSILSNSDATVPVYARPYTKSSGSTFDTTVTFTKPATAAAPAYLYVDARPILGFNKASADIYLNGAHIVSDGANDFSLQVTGFAMPVTLLAGTNTLRVVEHGTNPARFSLEVRATSNAPPALTISSPAPNLITKNTTLPVSGTVSDATSVTVTVNGVTAARGSGNSYSATVPLSIEGNNVITVHAVNAAGLSTDSTRTVKRDTQAPALLLSAPADLLLTNGDSVTVSGTLTDANAVTLTVQGVPVIVVSGAFSTRVALNEGPNFILVTATDAATNVATVTRSVTRTDAGGGFTPTPMTEILGADPAVVRPASNPTAAAPTPLTTAFLYSGVSPIQTGVQAGAIDSSRAGALRGRAIDRNAQPIQGAVVTVVGHPELGQTLTRANGLWDLAVNGGGDVIVRFAKTGFLPLQRKVAMPWQDIRAMDDVMLTAVSSTVTTIDFSQPVQVARGPVESDASGSRQATMLFKQGTQTTLELPGGGTQQLSTIHVRATEFTVGPRGLDAMPAELPPTAAYTYAVDLNSDEAIGAGGALRFTTPVAVYLENFLGFHVGTELPVGSYHPPTGRWVPEHNGRVVKILTVGGGTVTIDANGDGNATSVATLDSLGITASERSVLATLYSPGQTLWRWEAGHFSAWDANFSGYRADSSSSPFGPTNEPEPPNEAECPGCRLGVQSQYVAEDIGIQGTPFSLSYSSKRGPGGSRHTNIIRIPLTGPTVVGSVVGVAADIRVARRSFRQLVSPIPNQTVSFEWDGMDAYGRHIRGATVSVSRVFFTTYSYTPPPPGNGFGATCASTNPDAVCDTTGIPVRIPVPSTPSRPFAAIQGTAITLAQPDNDAAGLGGWSLSAHHFFDPSIRSLSMGDGRTLSASRVSTPGAARIAGASPPGNTGDGGPALLATFKGISTIAVAADGTLYVADSAAHVVRRIGRDGVVTRVAGTGTAGNGAPGGAATSTALNGPMGVAITPDGAIYIADAYNDRVLRLVGGSLELVAGGNGTGNAGDDSPAALAMLNRPTKLAVTRNGTILVLDRGNAVIRELSADGNIRRFAGGGSDCSTDGIAATRACLDPVDFGVLPDGRVVIATPQRIRVVDQSGTIQTAAGLATLGTCGNHDNQIGVSALDAGVCPQSLAVGVDGAVYLTELSGQLLRRIAPDGTVSQVRFCQDPISATALRGDVGRFIANAVLLSGHCKGVSAGADGSIFVSADSSIDRFDQVLPQYRNAAFRVVSQDGGEVYEFSDLGRHLRTIDALTNATMLTFGYDGQGRLTSITDTDTNVTTVQRDGTGVATAIVSPYGETTTLTIDGNGRLTQVRDPANATVTLGYATGGLLQTVTDPRANVASRFTYDSLGRVTREENAIGGSQNFARTVSDQGDTVRVTDGLSRTRSSFHTRGQNRDETTVAVDAAGLQTTSTNRLDGVAATTSPNQVVVTQSTIPDPRFGAQVRNTTKSTVRLPDNSTADVFVGRKVQLSNPTDPASLVSQTDTLVVAGQTFRGVYTVATRTFVTTSPEGRSSTMQLDANGRVMQVTTAGLAPINYAYDTRGRLASVTQGDRTETYAYNAQGRLASVTDPLTRVTSFNYDAAGRVTSEALPGARTVGFAYDSTGNLTSLTPPGKPAHTFAYNAVNLPTGYQAPTVSGSTGTTSYAYSVQKELLSLTRPDSQVVSVGYDATGRPAGITTAEGTHGIGYDASTGQVTSLAAPHGVAQSMTYNGALPTGTSWTGPVTGNVQYTYDNAFRLSGILVNGNSIAGPSYDRDGLPITNGFLQMTYRSDNGLLENLSAANYTGRWSYDSLAQVGIYAVTYDLTGDTLFRAAYTYDKLGRITQLAERVQADTATYVYGYDAAGRLATVQKSGATIAAYTYDLNGNRLQATYPSGNVVGTVDNQDRLLSYGANTYAYTGNGELKLKVTGTDSTKYRYDAFGNLRDVYLPTSDHIEYVIDAQQRRIGRKLNGTLQKGWLYQSQLAIAAEVDASGAVVKTFEYATHANVPDWMYANGVSYRIVTDHLGSVRLVVDVNGAVAQRIDYDAYGRVLTNTNPGFQPFGYAGGLLDDATGLTRFGARDYDTEAGRWTIQDPSGLAGGWNPYAHSLGDPVNIEDPDGKLVILLHGTFSSPATFSPAFRYAVAHSFPAQGIMTWAWSGDWSPDSRAQAGTDLGRFLRLYRQNHPSEPLTIIAHSHGGNVALNASRECGVFIDLLVTLGTPLLDVESARGPHVGRWVNVQSRGDDVIPIFEPNSSRTSSSADANVWFNSYGHLQLHDPGLWQFVKVWATGSQAR